MTRALLKKQMMEVFSWLYRNKKTGKNRSGGGLVTYVAFYLGIFVMVGVVFYFMAQTLCAPLVSAGLGWLYFALMGLLAVAFGVFGSVFNTFASLYQAGDNDLLLAMPVPPSRVLLARLTGVYAMGLLYELIVMLPALIVFFANASLNILGVLFSLLIPLLLSLFVLTLSCILGWVVALVSRRMRNKSVVTVALSLLFLAAYYYAYSQAYAVLQAILDNPEAVGSAVRSILFPFYHMGLAAEGSLLSMLIFAAIMAGAFGLVYFVLSHSFLRLATTNRGAAKAKYREKPVKAASVSRALLRKEGKRFLGSTTYMLNCGLGIVMMLAAAVALLIKGDAVLAALHFLSDGEAGAMALLAVAAICMLAAMNDISAPSVSLEGRSLWLVQVFPVSGRQVLQAKLTLHLLLTLPPLLVLTAVVVFVLRPTLFYAVLLFVVPLLFVLLTATMGLALNLKAPNLDWTNETAPVKQSMSVTVALLGGWGIVLVLSGLYFVVGRWTGPAVYLLLCAVALALASALLLLWLKGRGAKRFENLG